MSDPKKEMKNSQPAEEDKIQLPSAIELAQLAACFHSNQGAYSAIEVAMHYYLHATVFLKKIHSMSLTDLIKKYSEDDLFWDEVVWPSIEKEMLNLNPKNHTDDVRTFLAKNGLHLKTPRAVLNNLKSLHIAGAQNQKQSKEHGLTEFENCLNAARKEDDSGNVFYAFHKHDLNALVKWKKWKKSQGGKKSGVTRNAKV